MQGEDYTICDDYIMCEIPQVEMKWGLRLESMRIVTSYEEDIREHFLWPNRKIWAIITRKSVN